MQNSAKLVKCIAKLDEKHITLNGGVIEGESAIIRLRYVSYAFIKSTFFIKIQLFRLHPSVKKLHPEYCCKVIDSQ